MYDNGEGDNEDNEDDDEDEDDADAGDRRVDNSTVEKINLGVQWWQKNRDLENSGRLVVQLIRTLRNCVVVHHAIAFGSKLSSHLVEVLDATELSYEEEYGKKPVKSTSYLFSLELFV